MIHSKISDYFNLTYDEIIDKLKEKYGEVEGNYFRTKECKSYNDKIKRTKEGLFIHHVYEKKYQNLGDMQIARELSGELQEGKNLVYCNLLEHILLHIKIHSEYQLHGFGLGIIIKQLKDYLFDFIPQKSIENYFYMVKSHYVDKWYEYIDLVIYCGSVFNEIKQRDVIKYEIYKDRIRINYNGIFKFMYPLSKEDVHYYDYDCFLKPYMNIVLGYNYHSITRKNPGINNIQECVFEHEIGKYDKERLDKSIKKVKEICEALDTYNNCLIYFTILEDVMNIINKKTISSEEFNNNKNLLYMMLYYYLEDYTQLKEGYYPHLLYKDILIIEDYLSKKTQDKT